MLQSQGRLPHIVAGVQDRQPLPPPHEVVQVFPLYIFHDQKVQAANLVGVEGTNDIRMVQFGSSSYLAVETRQGIRVCQDAGVDYLDGDRPVHDLVDRQVDHAHAATPQLADDAIFRVVNQFRRQVARRGRGRRVYRSSRSTRQVGRLARRKG